MTAVLRFASIAAECNKEAARCGQQSGSQMCKQRRQTKHMNLNCSNCRQIFTVSKPFMYLRESTVQKTPFPPQVSEPRRYSSTELKNPECMVQNTLITTLPDDDVRVLELQRHGGRKEAHLDV